MGNIIEFNQLSGTVEYGYVCQDGNINQSETEIHMEKFHSLEELIKLVNTNTLEKIKEHLNADQVLVEAVSFCTQTPDSKEKVEFLLMRDEFYGQVIETA